MVWVVKSESDSSLAGLFSRRIDNIDPPLFFLRVHRLLSPPRGCSGGHWILNKVQTGKKAFSTRPFSFQCMTTQPCYYFFGDTSLRALYLSSLIKGEKKHFCDNFWSVFTKIIPFLSSLFRTCLPIRSVVIETNKMEKEDRDRDKISASSNPIDIPDIHLSRCRNESLFTHVETNFPDPPPGL